MPTSPKRKRGIGITSLACASGWSEIDLRLPILLGARRSQRGALNGHLQQLDFVAVLREWLRAFAGSGARSSSRLGRHRLAFQGFGGGLADERRRPDVPEDDSHIRRPPARKLERD